MSPGALVVLLRGLDLLVLGLEMAPAIRAAFSTVTRDVEIMLEEDRDPTPEEWARLDELRNTIHRSIQEAPTP